MSGRGRPAVHPWDEWFSRAPIVLKRGRDFDPYKLVDGMRAQCYAAGKARGLRIRTTAIDSESFRLEVGAPAAINWDSILYARTAVALTQGIDFNSSVETMRQRLYHQARKRGLRAKVFVDGNSILVEAYPIRMPRSVELQLEAQERAQSDFDPLLDGAATIDPVGQDPTSPQEVAR